jgi:preprotein translocase subunit SecD
MKKPEKGTSKDTLNQLKGWVLNQPDMPPDREVGYEVVYDTDHKSQKEVEAGYRTYFLKSRAEITGDLIRDAAAVPDQGQDSFGQWHVALTFTDQVAASSSGSPARTSSAASPSSSTRRSREPR